MLKKCSLGSVLVVVFLSGCTATYTQNRGNDAGLKLEASSPVYIVTPKNGSFNGKEYLGSGEMTESAINAAFSVYADEVNSLANCALDTCLSSPNGPELGYLVEPKILHWEDRATEWSGKSDRLSIKITIYNLPSKNRLSQVILDGKSKWATFGGDHPQDLLAKPIGEYVDSLY